MAESCPRSLTFRLKFSSKCLATEGWGGEGQEIIIADMHFPLSRGREEGKEGRKGKKKIVTVRS